MEFSRTYWELLDYHPLDEPIDIPYNASYFNIEVSESSYKFEYFMILVTAVIFGILNRRRKFV